MFNELIIESHNLQGKVIESETNNIGPYNRAIKTNVLFHVFVSLKTE